MGKEILSKQLQRCKVQLSVPCLDCSYEQHHLHYHLHVASEHLELRILAFLFLKVLIKSTDSMTCTIFAVVSSTSFLVFFSQALRSCFAQSLIFFTNSGSCRDRKALWYIIKRTWSVTMWTFSPLFMCFPSRICFTVVGPYRSDSDQQRSMPLFSMKEPSVRSCAMSMCSSPGRRIRWLIITCHLKLLGGLVQSHIQRNYCRPARTHDMGSNLLHLHENG